MDIGDSSRIQSEEEQVELKPVRQIAGFWRRLIALCLDVLVLGVVGFAIGYIFRDALVGLTFWGRLLGLAITLLYCVPLNSYIGKGKTVGKRLLGIKVVGRDGKYLSLPRATARCLFLELPFFFNQMQLPTDVVLSPVFATIFSFLIFGMGGSIIYLYIFNTKTRQSLHDLVVGSYVVRDKSDRIESLPTVRKFHYVIVGVILVIATVVIPVVGGVLVEKKDFKHIIGVQKAAAQTQEVIFASTVVGWQSSDEVTTTYVEVTAYVKTMPEDHEILATKIAKNVIEKNPSVREIDALKIVLVRGFDIGISKGWVKRNVSHSPAEWQAKFTLF